MTLPNWGYILFNDVSNDAIYDSSGNYSSGSIMEYSVVEYAGGSSVSNNGAVRMNSAHPFINYCTIQNNSASGINAQNISGTLKITKSTIMDNKSSGVSVSHSSGGTTKISDNTIRGNTATSSSGGGIYSYYGTVTITNNTISGNTASSSGGGIYGGGVISKNSLTGNTAKNTAAAYYPDGNNKDFKYNVITGNKADDTTVYISSNPLFNYNNIFSNNTASYDLWYGKSQSSSDLNAENNWWGSSDDATVQGKIYDFIDDSTKALVDYLPYDTAIRTDCPISPPTGLTATAGTNYINLSWTANSESDAKGYKVYWDTDSGHAYANSVDVGNVTSYTITSLAGSKYYVTVTAYDTSYSAASDDTSTIVNENMTNGNESWYAEEKAVTFSSDTTPPTVSSTSPASGATGVAVNTAITATFSEAMDSTTISTSTFTLSGVTGTVSYDSTTKTATFTPSSNLGYSTTYTTTITTSVKDSAGNAMSSNYTWSFTTTSGPDTTAPTGSISINSGAAYTKSASVTLSLSATDGVGVIGYYLSESSATPLASASGWTTVSSTTSYSGSISYTLSSGDSNKTVYVWYKDAAGNVSSSANDAITLDTTAPTVTITSPTSGSTYTTTSSTISLSGSASDSTSGVSSVTWSSDKGSSGTASGTTSWSISNISLSSGDNVITVTATDGAGNTKTDTITVTYNAGPTALGTLSLSKDTAYLSGDTIVATVVDADRNTSTSVANTLTTALKVTGTNYSVGTDLNLSLVETSSLPTFITGYRGIL